MGVTICIGPAVSKSPTPWQNTIENATEQTVNKVIFIVNALKLNCNHSLKLNL